MSKWCQNSIETSINDATIKEELSTSQKQAVIKLIEKKNREKLY